MAEIARADLQLLYHHPQVVKRELKLLTPGAWERRSRPKQWRPPGSRIWLVQTGRFWGKTLTAAQEIRLLIEGGAKHILAIGPTATVVHDVMVRKLMEVLEANRLSPVYRATTDAPSISASGCIIHLRSGQRPDRCRGLEVSHVWGDEVDYWKPEGMTAAEALLTVVEPCVRVVPATQTYTSTPRRGGLVAQLIKRADVVVTRGHSRENADNVAPGTVEGLSAAYAGSWQERQELGGELVLDLDGALVTHAMIEAGRVSAAPELRRIVVGVDPSGGTEAQGIVAAGLGVNGHVYVLSDRTCTMTPDGWGRRVVETFDALDADRVVAERNFGGDMVESTLRTVRRDLPLRLVTASRGKHVRFEPVAALYEQGRLHHVGALPELEDEVTAFTPNGYEGQGSPNRADALVWAVLDLVGRRGVNASDLYPAAEAQA